MINQIRLRFNRNTDVRTEFYYLYRYIKSGVTVRSPRIMKVKQIYKPNPLDVINERALMISDTIYQLNHVNLFTDRPVVAIVNGKEVPSNTYIVDYEQGYLIFDQAVPVNAKVEVSYTFDGIEVIDDNVPQDIVLHYYGPPPEDVGNIDPPKNLTLTPNMVSGHARLDYETQESRGQSYYYRAEARSEKGDYSYLSNEISLYLKEDVKQIIVETLNQDGKWEMIGTTKEEFYIDGPIDKEPPEPLQNLQSSVTPNLGTGTSDVQFSWDFPFNYKLSYTPEYRVRTQLENNVLSQPSPSVGPKLVSSSIRKIVIRRKVDDGSYPTYDDPTATTVAEITDVQTLSFIDTVDSNIKYAYSFFVVDDAGNISPATVLSIFIESTLPPGAVTVTGSIFNIII